MPLIRNIQCRFYGGLNFFLLPERRSRLFCHTVKGVPSIKDTLEALGVPHTEIDCIVVNGKSVGFSYQIRGGEHIEVYPEAPSGSSFLRLKPPVPIHPKFTVDVHLGKLARHLRLLGFDTIYEKDMTDARIVDCSSRSKRIVLTRDLGLLKHWKVRYGYFVRAIEPAKQIREVLRRFHLVCAKMHPFRRCLECNGMIRRIAKAKIEDRLPPLTRKYYREFYHCPSCDKIYWQGAHYKQLSRLINAVKR